MTRLKTPLLSLGAHGTLADALTIQHRNKTDFARTKPIPTDRKTLPQIYHRWDYYDYAQRWHDLDPAVKLGWRKKGSKVRMTGFNAFMQTQLNTLPNLLLRAYLDEGGGTIAYDSSKGNHNGTLLAPTWIDGVLGKALSFDGVDDYVNFGTDLSLAPKREFSVEFLFYPRSLANSYVAGRLSRQPWCISINATKIRLNITDTANLQWIARSTIPLTLNHWQYLRLVYNPDIAKAHFQIDDAQETINYVNKDLQQLVGWSTYLGSRPEFPASSPFKGYIDHFSLYDRVISAQEGLYRYNRIKRV